MLRRLPVLAHARYIKTDFNSVPKTALKWIQAMQKVLDDEKGQRQLIAGGGLAHES